jgi:hypothetical protein
MRTFPELFEQLADFEKSTLATNDLVHESVSEQEQFAHLISSIQDLAEHIHQAATIAVPDEVINACHALVEKAETIVSETNLAVQAAEGSLHHAEATVRTADGELETAVVETMQAFSQLRDTLDESDHLGESLGQEMSALKDELSGEVAETHQRALDFHESCATSLQHYSDTVQNEFTQTVTSTSSSIEDRLATQEIAELRSAHASFDQETSAGMRHLAESVAGLSNNLHTEGCTFFDQVDRAVSGAFETAANNTIRTLAENAIREFENEVEENFMLMEIGEQTTAALAPILPELAAAKAAISVINDIKSGLFGG